jgi:hypothetical protein
MNIRSWLPYVCVWFVVASASGCAPSKGHSVADKDVPEMRLPKATLLRYLGRSTKSEVAEWVPPPRDPFLTEEEDLEASKPTDSLVPPPPLPPVPTQPHTPSAPPVHPPKNPPSSVAGVLIGSKPMFFFKNDTYGLGDTFMGAWIVDGITGEKASMHWEKNRDVTAFMRFAHETGLEIKKG